MTVNTDGKGNGSALRIIDAAVTLGGHLERVRVMIAAMSERNTDCAFSNTDIVLMQTGHLKRQLRAAVRAVEAIEYDIEND